MWTDETLATAEAHRRELAKLNDDKFLEGEAELFRLCRLGLAAEQVGRTNLEEAVEWGRVLVWENDAATTSLQSLISHPAWRR